MKNSLDLTQAFRPFATFMKKHHVVIFSLTVVIGVAAALYLFNNLLVMSSPEKLPTQSSSEFDQSTIDQIDGLNRAGDGTADFTLPPGRTNPFSE